MFNESYINNSRDAACCVRKHTTPILPLNGRCTQSPNVAMGIATLTRHRLTSQSIFQGPRSPYIAKGPDYSESSGNSVPLSQLMFNLFT